MSIDDLVRQHFDAARQRSRAPGLAYGIVRDGKLEMSGGCGRLYAGGPVPDERSIFRIASMTKSFTAAAVLRARDEGLLALDDPVATLVPSLGALRPPTDDAAELTVRQLLTMDSGLAQDDPWADRHLDASREEMDALFAAGATFAVPPGTAFEYSNLGYAVLGRIVEEAVGVPLQEYVTSAMLRPLGMADTRWSVPGGDDGADTTTRAARPHRPVPGVVGTGLVDGSAVEDIAPLADGGFGPIGGLWSTVADLARWVSFLCDGFPPRDGQDSTVLRRASRREMQRAWRAGPLTLSLSRSADRMRFGPGYGMGLSITEDVRLGAIVSHSGGLPGFGSNMRWLPHRRVGVIALANVTYAPMSEVTYDALDLLEDHGWLPALPSRRSRPIETAAESLCALINAWDENTAAGLLADNVFLDEGPAIRAAHARGLHERHGALSVEDVVVRTATNATVTLAGERGAIRLEVELSPQRAPRIQRYECTSLLPLDEGTLALLAQLPGAAEAPSALRRLIADETGVAAIVAELRGLYRRCGTGSFGEVRRNDGSDEIVVRWRGERFDADVTLTLTATTAGSMLQAIAHKVVPRTAGQ